jgi:hypothetical protein
MSNTYINENGYRCFKDSGIPVHRWVAEKKLGRRLRPGEVVHHKDRNKLNNSPDNLYVFPNQWEHYKAHLRDADKYGCEYSFKGRAGYFEDDDDDFDDFEDGDFDDEDNDDWI